MIADTAATMIACGTRNAVSTAIDATVVRDTSVGIAVGETDVSLGSVPAQSFA